MSPSPARPPDAGRGLCLAERAFVAVVLARAGVGAGVRAVVGGRRAAVLHPLDARGHQRAGRRAALGGRALAGGDEGDADGLDLPLRVEVLLLLHALGVQRVAERAEAVQADGLALRHIVGQHAGHLGQHGHDVGVADGGDLRQATGDGFQLDGLAHHYCLREIDSRLLIELLFVESHTKKGFKCLR